MVALDASRRVLRINLGQFLAARARFVRLPVAEELESSFRGHFDQHSVVTVPWSTEGISVDNRRAIREDRHAAVREGLLPREQPA